MYKAYYRLRGDPFRLSPDHAFCYRYPSFAKGRAYMQYALQAAEGFVVVTGAPGMGKTTLINDLLSDYGPSDYLVATLVNTMLEANDILRSTAYEFGINVEGLDTATVLQRIKQLFTQSHQDGRPPLLVVDEAQNLSLSALEELRLLTNLQIQGKPLLQIFLVGQEGLREKLADPRLEQLRQRVTAAAHLNPLTQEQTAAYILHRLKVVGWNNFPRIKASVLPVIEVACQGVPRRINQFCSRLLLHGAVEEKAVLSSEDANTVFQELSEERLSHVPVGLGSTLGTEFIGEPEREEDTGETGGAAKEPVFANAEELLREQKKVVMPRPHAAAPLVGAADFVPTMEETFGGSRGPRVHRRHRRPETDHDSREPVGAPEPYPPVRRPPPRRSGVGWVVVLALLIGAGAYAWYQMDRRAFVTLLDRQIEMYLPDPADDTAASDVAALTADLPPTLGAGNSAPGAGALSAEPAETVVDAKPAVASPANEEKAR